MDSFDLIKNIDFKSDKNYNPKILSWLLDPTESHGLRYEFLENFLLLINKKIDKKGDYIVVPNYTVNYSENLINNIKIFLLFQFLL